MLGHMQQGLELLPASLSKDIPKAAYRIMCGWELAQVLLHAKQVPYSLYSFQFLKTIFKMQVEGQGLLASLC